MRRRSVATLFTLTALLAACGSDTSTADPSPPATATPGTVTPSTVTPSTSSSSTVTPTDAGGGWIGGEPTWTNGDTAGVGGYSADTGTAGGAPVPGVASAADGSTAATTAGASEPGVPSPQGNSPLRAGSVDDNADFAAYLDYLARIHGLGIVTRDFDPTGRIVVSVTGTSGLPVAGAEVTVSAAGTPIATVRTTADGTARFLPALYGAAATTSFDFALGTSTASAAPNGTVALASDAPGGAQQPVAVDVLFLLDATGSMGDEIDRLKTTIDSVAGRIAGLDSHPDVRFGMTLYRDLHDSFVTSTFDFTSDVDAFRAAIGDVTAEGGDDYPEAMDEGLADALSAPAWRDPASTVQLVFLVADAPPQVARDVQTPYPVSIVNAVARGVKIIPIASSESDDQAEAVFRQLAEATGGRFVFLSYGAGGAATGGNTDIASTDYEELSLDDLIVRLVGEELTALTGQAQIDTDPTDTNPSDSSPPTNPPGQ